MWSIYNRSYIQNILEQPIKQCYGIQTVLLLSYTYTYIYNIYNIEMGKNYTCCFLMKRLLFFWHQVAKYIYG